MTTLPLTTNWPNALTTEPAFPVDRICLVTEMLIASRNIVVSSNRLGNAENSSALFKYIEVTTIIRPPEMFNVMKKSSSVGGSGMISIVTTVTTATAAIRSVRARIRSRIPTLADSAITASPRSCT